jgi:hypothetical protein
VHSQTYLNKVARQLNEQPRKTLTFETPAERFNAPVLHRLVEPTRGLAAQKPIDRFKVNVVPERSAGLAQ